MGAGALVLVVVAVVLLTRGGPSPTIERGDGVAFPLRGSLAGDQSAIDDALKAWKDRRGAAADSRLARFDDEVVHVLYAGTVGERSVVVVRQGDRLIGIHQPLDRGWVVGDVQDDFDPFLARPVVIDESVLLPAGGDWTYLPLRPGGPPARTADGLISSGYAYGSLDEGFVVEGGAPAQNRVAKVYDTVSGLFNVNAKTYRAITDAARHPGRLTAIHAGLVGPADVTRVGSSIPFMDVLWTGRVPGAREAAVVARDDPRLGLGLVRDPDGLVSSAETVVLGAHHGALGAERRDDVDPPHVAAAYVGGGDGPETLVAAADGPVDHIEFLVGTRRFTRPGPVAVVPVDWDTGTTDVVVMGRTAGGAVIAPLAPESR